MPLQILLAGVKHLHLPVLTELNYQVSAVDGCYFSLLDFPLPLNSTLFHRYDCSLNALSLTTRLLALGLLTTLRR